VQPLPDAGCLPIAQSSPTGGPTATAQLLRQEPPRAASPQREDDAAEGRAVRDPRATTVGLRRLFREQGFDSLPELIRDKS
jgi:hypothetical protein